MCRGSSIQSSLVTEGGASAGTVHRSHHVIPRSTSEGTAAFLSRVQQDNKERVCCCAQQHTAALTPCWTACDACERGDQRLSIKLGVVYTQSGRQSAVHWNFAHRW